MHERRAGNDIEFETANGPVSAYRSVPAAGRGPGVVVLAFLRAEL